MSRPKTSIPQPEGATTMERLDKMVRTIFAACRSSSDEPHREPPRHTPNSTLRKRYGKRQIRFPTFALLSLIITTSCGKRVT